MDDDERIDGSVADGESGLVIEREAGETATEAIVRGIATIRGVAETEVDPLYDQLEVEALERLVRRANDRDRPLRVTFAIDEYAIIVRENGRIRILADPDLPALDC